MGIISVSLPADGTTMDVADYNTPVTSIVTEINGNIDNANIKSGAAIATSKLADDAGITAAKLATGSVEASKLATSAITLGYTQVTSNFTTTATAETDVTGLSVTVTVPAGGRRIKITVYVPWIEHTAATTNVITMIKEGSTSLQQQHSNFASASARQPKTLIYVSNTAPTAGSHTYKVTNSTNQAGTSTYVAHADYPAFILVEAI